MVNPTVSANGPRSNSRYTNEEMSFTPYPNEVYTTFSFFGLLMCIIPLPWHLKAWNVGTCCFMFWAGIGCFIFFVNSIVWHGNSLNPAPIWCDISVKIVIGTFTGISTSSLCINRRLYLLQLDPVKNFAITNADKIRSIAVDLCIALVLPTVFMMLHFVYQGHRFDIRENIGCTSHTRNTWVAVLLRNVPPALIGIASATYGFCAIISINRRRTQFNELLSHRMKITSSLYFRLMCFAGMEAIITTPIAVSYIILNVGRIKLYPTISSERSRVVQYPATIWHNLGDATAYEFIRWIHVICAFMFFSVFGFAEEAKSHYRFTIHFFLKLVGFQVGRQTETLTEPRSFMLQSNPAAHLTFAHKTPRRSDSLSTISISPDGGRGRYSASDDTQVYVADRLGFRMDPDAPGDSLTPTTKPHVTAAVVEQEDERMPRNTQQVPSFLGDSSTQRVSPAPSPGMDISKIEEGRSSSFK